MEQARDFAQQVLASRGGEEAPPAKEKQAGEAGAGGGFQQFAQAATHLMSGGGGEERPEEAGAGEKATGGGGLAGMAGNLANAWLHGGGEGGPKEGAGASGGSGGLLSTAQEFLGGEHASGATAEGGAKAEPSLVDRLLSMYSQTQGKQFEGQEHEYDQLAKLAQNVMGTPIGREVVKSWVKQRLGI